MPSLSSLERHDAVGERVGDVDHGLERDGGRHPVEDHAHTDDRVGVGRLGCSGLTPEMGATHAWGREPVDPLLDVDLHDAPVSERGEEHRAAAAVRRLSDERGGQGAGDESVRV